MADPSARVQIPSFELGERLGAGGFGEVFAARDTVIKRDVAIKILHAKYSTDAGAIARFTAEAVAVAKISHPGIVEVFEFGALADGRQYFVMERLHGQALRELLRERTRLPLAEALPILRGIAAAVDAAHAAGIAHRDLKPDNVFVLPDGSVKLIDFGLAKLTTATDAPVTETGSVFGTPLYMSPEQCRGRAADLPTDAYSFGALAYHVLAGAPPFTGEPIELALHHLNDTPRPPSARCPELPRRVDHAILALLAKDPADRPMPLASAVSAMAGDTTLRRRRKLGRWLAAAALIAIVGGSIAWAATRGPEAAVADLPEMCTPAPAMLEGVWDPVRRATIASQFAASPRSDVATTWQVMSAALDELFAQWATRWDATCSSDERRSNPLLHAQRLTCLERFYYNLRGHADGLASADAGDYSSAFTGRGIYPISDCENPAVLRAEPPQIAAAKRALASAHMRSLFDDSARHYDAVAERGDRAKVGMARTKRDAEALEQLGSPLAAVAWTVHANHVLEWDDFAKLDEVQAPLRHAATLAQATRFDAQLLELETLRAYLELGWGTLAEARAAVDRAEQAGARAGRPFAMVHLQAQRALVETRSGRHAVADELLRTALRELERGPMPIAGNQLRRSLVAVAIADGRPADAVRDGRDAVAQATRVLGPHHGITIVSHHALAQALAANGEFAAATRELAGLPATPGPPGISYALATLALLAGDDAGVRAVLAKLPAMDLGRPEVQQGVFAQPTVELLRFALDRTPPNASPRLQREIDDDRAVHAFWTGDFDLVKAATSRVIPVRIAQPERISAYEPLKSFFASLWLDAVVRARAGQHAAAERALSELAYVHELNPYLSAPARMYDALVLAALQRWPDAAVAARKSLEIRAWHGFRGHDRAEAATYLGVILVEQNELAAAREPLEEALVTQAQWAVAPLWFLAVAQFALARALWPTESERPRARRLAETARDGYARLGKHRAHQHQAVIAWLADPAKPVTVRMLP